MAVVVADVVTDVAPVVSNIKDAMTALTGVNPVTGEKVGLAGRVAAAIFAIPGLGNLLKLLAKGGKILKALRVLGRAIAQAVDRLSRGVLDVLNKRLGKTSAANAGESGGRTGVEQGGAAQAGRESEALGKSGDEGGTAASSRNPAELEEERLQSLGMDPATGKFRPGERETAMRVERERNVRLARAPAGSKADWVDEAQQTYDAVGNFPAQYFDRQWDQLQYQIERHLDKANFVPVDVSKFTPDQIAKVEKFIADKGFGPRVFLVGL